ncbi:hypothetical protein GCM10010331_44760 [Streptomyces xanthochromogenes]|uniref:hypothetical protein n=1 Tax=Streptomyces xanthochromogenes TaxID=67384 RepID=UPI0016740241|nr:hypothetical protein [Streptomyces xanthochromogenes]GHB52223.1 hypothetical protein GCM10010331_44760 [Streptomyces xanthochromogenes]
MGLSRRLREVLPGHRFRDRVARRSAVMAQADLMDWADQGVTQLSRTMTELRKSPGAEELEAAADGLVVVAVVLEEMARRQRAGL